MSRAESSLNAIFTVWSFVGVLAFVHWVTDKPLTWEFALSVAAGATLANLVYIAIHKAAGA